MPFVNMPTAVKALATFFGGNAIAARSMHWRRVHGRVRGRTWRPRHRLRSPLLQMSASSGRQGNAF